MHVITNLLKFLAETVVHLWYTHNKSLQLVNGLSEDLEFLHFIPFSLLLTLCVASGKLLPLC